MVKRRTIGLIYQYNENWIGGTYYIQNLIAAINCLPDTDKPNLVIFTRENKEYEDLKTIVPYPYISGRSFIKGNFFVQNINKISKKLINKKILKDYHTDVDLVFPANNEERFKPGQKFLYWIPDFQEHYLPQFFTEAEVIERKSYQTNLINRAKYILFSSLSVQKDFNAIYAANKVEQFVVPFAVTHTINKATPAIQEKYKIPSDYFICSNQFWKHKNHSIVLEALSLLKKEYKNFHVVFTGKEHDYRNPDFFDILKQKAKDLDVTDNISFLGFISREDQISLIRCSLSVVQPSLFEGWSTVIEDAKALNVAIIASDIDVHKEQLIHYEAIQFFASSNAQSLATCLQQAHKRFDFIYDYKQDVINFGKKFQHTFEKIIQS